MLLVHPGRWQTTDTSCPDTRNGEGLVPSANQSSSHALLFSRCVLCTPQPGCLNETMPSHPSPIVDGQGLPYADRCPGDVPPANQVGTLFPFLSQDVGLVENHFG